VPINGVFTPRLIDKPWGREEIWALSKDYCGKRITVRAGHALSLQYHEQKHETMFCVAGRGVLELGSNSDELRPISLTPGVGVVVPVGKVHRLRAAADEEIVVFEASTTQLQDVVRLVDDYGRAGNR